METTSLPAHALPILHLFKGIVYRQQEVVWRELQHHLREVKAHFASVGLEVYVDEAEGYPLLRQRAYTEEQQSWPKLSEERQLSYPVTLLCVLLRRRLLEADAQDGSTGVVVTSTELKEQLSVFLPLNGTDETRIVKQLDSYLNKLIDLRFLRPLKGEAGSYEISRVLSAYIKIEDLELIVDKLRNYYTNWSKTRDV